MKISMVPMVPEMRLSAITFGTIFQGRIDYQSNGGTWLKTHAGILNLAFPYKHWDTSYFATPVVHGYKELGLFNVEMEKGD